MRRIKRKKKTPWPRWAKILRNLLTAFFLLAIVWDVMDLSLPARLEFRRLERMALAPPSRITTDITTRDPFYPHILIGLTEDWAMAGAPYTISRELSGSNIYPLEDGANLICLRRAVGVPDWAGQVISHAAYAALRPPEGSASAVLTLHNGDGDFTAKGVRDGEIFLFYFRPEDVMVYNRLVHPDEYTYELTFYDENGDVIQEITG